MSRIWVRRVVFPLPRKPARSDTGGDSAAAALNSVTDEAPAARRRKLFDDQATRLWEEAAKETHRKNICRTIKRSGSSRMTHFDFNPILAVWSQSRRGGMFVPCQSWHVPNSPQVQPYY